MLEIKSLTYLDKRNGSLMFQMTMKNGGKISSSSVSYDKISIKSLAKQELSSMIMQLCDNVYTILE